MGALPGALGFALVALAAPGRELAASWPHLAAHLVELPVVLLVELVELLVVLPEAFLLRHVPEACSCLGLGCLPVGGLVELVELVELPVHGPRSWLFMPEGHVAKRYVQGVPAEPAKDQFPCAPGGPPNGCIWRNV